MSTAGMEGLRPDQAPPLFVPTAFYVAAPVALAAAGMLLLVRPTAFEHRWTPEILAATHLLTLGYLGSIMLGSVYQVAPVVAGAPVPGARAAGGVLALWLAGIAALVAAFLTGSSVLFLVAPMLLAAALSAFLVPVAVAMVRAPARGPTVGGMRVAVSALLGVGALGVTLALVRAGRVAVPDLVGLVDSHAGIGAFAWIGGLLTAVSWQIVPMFYLTPPLPRWSQWPTVGALAASGITLFAGRALGDPSLGALALPAAVAAWGVHPVLTARAIVGRRRKRADFSLRFWLAGLACGALSLLLFVGAVLGSDPRWAVALGWTAGVGWAGLVTHGMLARIVPFLIWFHRFSPLLGKVPVPTMRELLPEKRLKPALALHGATVLAGLLAIALRIPALVAVNGALLVATASLLGINVVSTLRRTPG